MQRLAKTLPNLSWKPYISAVSTCTKSRTKRYSSIIICSACTYQQPSGHSYWNLENSLNKITQNRKNKSQGREKWEGGAELISLSCNMEVKWQVGFKTLTTGWVVSGASQVYLWSLISLSVTQEERERERTGFSSNNKHSQWIQSGHIIQKKHQGKSTVGT